MRNVLERSHSLNKFTFQNPRSSPAPNHDCQGERSKVPLPLPFQKNYFTSSDPHQDMLGGGCQVRVVIENMMGGMENLKTLISGFLGLVILVRWALVTMFLS